MDGWVKDGRSPAKRILDAAICTNTLKGLGQAKPCCACPRARPAARTSPPWGGDRGGEPGLLALVRLQSHAIGTHSKFKRANKIFFALKNASGVIIKEVRLPPGEVKNDPFFGTMEVYKKPFQIEITLDRTTKAKHFTLVAGYQGCNEVIGVCYPPQQTSFDLTLP